MDRKRTRGKYAGFHQTVFALSLGDGAWFVRVDRFWHEPIDDADDGNSSEKCAGTRPRPDFLGAISLSQLRGSFGKNFHKRDIQHHAG